MIITYASEFNLFLPWKLRFKLSLRIISYMTNAKRQRRDDFSKPGSRFVEVFNSRICVCRRVEVEWANKMFPKHYIPCFSKKCLHSDKYRKRRSRQVRDVDVRIPEKVTVFAFYQALCVLFNFFLQIHLLCGVLLWLSTALHEHAKPHVNCWSGLSATLHKTV